MLTFTLLGGVQYCCFCILLTKTKVTERYCRYLFNTSPVFFYRQLEYVFKYQTVPTRVYVRFWKSSLAYGFTRTTTISLMMLD